VPTTPPPRPTPRSGTPEYQIFTGFFDWHDGNWVQSATQTVKPGDSIFGSVLWEAATGTYTQCISANGGAPICTRVSKANEHGETFNQVFFVVEHQPNACTEYPASGSVTFTDISVVFESGEAAPWSIHTYKPACKSAGRVLNSSALEFTWATS
jgi:hypothetical protein